MELKDLRTGMKIVLRDSKKEYILFTDLKTEYNNFALFSAISNQICNWITLEDYNDNLTHKNFHYLDIIEVYLPEHPYAIAQFFGTNYGASVYSWKLIWDINGTLDIPETLEDKNEKLKTENKHLKKAIKLLEEEVRSWKRIANDHD